MSCECEKRDPLRDTVTSALLSPLASGKIAHVTCVLGLAYLGKARFQVVHPEVSIIRQPLYSVHYEKCILYSKDSY